MLAVPQSSALVALFMSLSGPDAEAVSHAERGTEEAVMGARRRRCGRNLQKIRPSRCPSMKNAAEVGHCPKWKGLYSAIVAD